MGNTILRIELFCHSVQPRHTAFFTTRIRGNFAAWHRRRQREIASKGEKPPPAPGHSSPHSGQLNALVLRAVDFAFMRRVGCFLFFLCYYRARGPPLQDFNLL